MLKTLISMMIVCRRRDLRRHRIRAPLAAAWIFSNDLTNLSTITVEHSSDYARTRERVCLTCDELWSTGSSVAHARTLNYRPQRRLNVYRTLEFIFISYLFQVTVHIALYVFRTALQESQEARRWRGQLHFGSYIWLRNRVLLWHFELAALGSIFTNSPRFFVQASPHCTGLPYEGAIRPFVAYCRFSKM